VPIPRAQGRKEKMKIKKRRKTKKLDPAEGLRRREKQIKDRIYLM